MKKIGFMLVPVVLFLLMMQVIPRLFSSGMSPAAILAVVTIIFAVMFLSKPRKAATKTAQAVSEDVLDAYCANAFQDNPELRSRFFAALNDIGANMPKAAVNKLSKLEPQCSAREEKYAVAVACALAYRNQNDLKNAIREYNKAIVLNPTARLAYTIGDCNQRLGYLDKARDSYEFAQELDPSDPRYPSSLSTVCVGDGDYDAAIDYAAEALDLKEDFPQALASMAICYGMKDNALLHKRYLQLASESGYSEQKILDTIKALKKRESR